MSKAENREAKMKSHRTNNAQAIVLCGLLALSALFFAPHLASAQCTNCTVTGTGALASPSLNASYDSAFGFNALNANTTGSYNTASGENALFIDTTGSYNTASGQGALYSNTTGSENTASGVS